MESWREMAQVLYAIEVSIRINWDFIHQISEDKNHALKMHPIPQSKSSKSNLFQKVKKPSDEIFPVAREEKLEKLKEQKWTCSPTKLHLRLPGKAEGRLWKGHFLWLVGDNQARQLPIKQPVTPFPFPLPHLQLIPVLGIMLIPTIIPSCRVDLKKPEGKY